MNSDPKTTPQTNEAAPNEPGKKMYQVQVKHCGKCGAKADIQTGETVKQKRGGKASIRSVKIHCPQNCGNPPVVMKSVPAAVAEWNRKQIEKHAARSAQAKKEQGQ